MKLRMELFLFYNLGMKQGKDPCRMLYELYNISEIKRW